METQTHFTRPSPPRTAPATAHSGIKGLLRLEFLLNQKSDFLTFETLPKKADIMNTSKTQVTALTFSDYLAHKDDGTKCLASITSGFKKAGKAVTDLLAKHHSPCAKTRANNVATIIAAALAKAKLNALEKNGALKNFYQSEEASMALGSAEYARGLVEKNTGYEISFSGKGMSLTVVQCKRWMLDKDMTDLPVQKFTLTAKAAKAAKPEPINAKNDAPNPPNDLLPETATTEQLAAARIEGEADAIKGTNLLTLVKRAGLSRIVGALVAAFGKDAIIVAVDNHTAKKPALAAANIASK